MGKDGPVFDAASEDCRKVFKVSLLILETSASRRILTAMIIGYLQNTVRPWQLFKELSLKQNGTS